MSSLVVTLDFHETIVHCDEWFELEVRRLPSAFFAWWARENGKEPDLALAASADASYRRLRRAIHDHGHELPAERCIAMISELLGIAIAPADIDRGTRSLMRTALDSAQPTDGIVETIADLSRAGVVLGIVSSAVYHPFLLWTLGRFGIDDRFRVVTTSASAGFYKSRPEIFWQTLDRLRAAPQASVHIGDSLRFDVGGARRAGMRTAWLNERSAAVVGPDKPDLTLATMRDAAPQVIALLNGCGR